MEEEGSQQKRQRINDEGRASTPDGNDMETNVSNKAFTKVNPSKGVEEQLGIEDAVRDEDGDEVRDDQFYEALFDMVMTNRTRELEARRSSSKEMINKLKGLGYIKSKSIEEAALAISRSFFVPSDMQDEAFLDESIKLNSLGITISSPSVEFLSLENLDIQKGNRILDIGCGSGYFTTLASHLIGKEGEVDAMDIDKEVIEMSKSNYKKVFSKGIELSKVNFILRNCFLPVSQTTLYDRIHIGASLPESKLDDILKLLKPSGILVTPMNEQLVKVTKNKEGIKKENIISVKVENLELPSQLELNDSIRSIERERSRIVKVPSTSFSQDFEKLINNKELSDIILIVEDQPIYAHKVILGARSEHFRAMFFSGLRESRESSVTIPGISFTAFMDILKFIYVGDLSLESADHAIEILNLSNYFKLDRLKAMCENIIKESIDIESAAYLLAISSQHAAMQLRTFTLEYIMSHYDEVSVTKCFDELDKHLLLEVTREACKYLKNV